MIGFPFPTCPVCGVPIHDFALHRRFHDGLREVCRKVYAPDMTPEEYAQAVELAGIDLALNEIAEQQPCEVPSTDADGGLD